MIITIEGKQGEGKTTLSREITENKRVLHVTQEYTKYQILIMIAAEKPDYVIVEEITQKKRMYQIFKELEEEFINLSSFTFNTILIIQSK